MESGEHPRVVSMMRGWVDYGLVPTELGPPTDAQLAELDPSASPAESSTRYSHAMSFSR